MTNVYFRRANGSLGHIQVMADEHNMARAAVMEALAEEWRKPPHPVLAVVSTSREGWDG